MTAGYIFNKNQQAHTNLETNAWTYFDICNIEKKVLFPVCLNHFAFLKRMGGADTITKLDDDVINS